MTGMIILSGIVGSVAYGLNNENSDIDRLGVYVEPTRFYWSLQKPEETKSTTKPDVCYHEIEKFLRLCCKCNPTVMELLWLDQYKTKEPTFGRELIDLRTAFLSTNCVRSAYGGYAYSQFRKLTTSESKRKFKHIKHCFRLLRQGIDLLATGRLTLKVPNPEEYKAFENMDIEKISLMFQQEYQILQLTKSVLPDKPDIDTINDYLYNIRFSCVFL